MKFILIALAAALFVASAQHLPEVLVERARAIIHRAELILHGHHEGGRHHLTQALEHEIQELRKLEHELLALEKSRHLEIHEVHVIEERLLHHENRLTEEILKVEHAHHREQEEHKRRGEGETREHQGELLH